MSKFRVGQRVRIVRCKNTPWANGLQATIVAKASVLIATHWRVAIDGHPGPFYGGWETYEQNLEPATDCYDKTEWSECVWKPEHLRVGA